MIKPIVKDVLFLSQKSQPADKKDRSVGQDLKDTLEAHKDHCVGLAANMIGSLKNIIVVDTGKESLVLYNPKILFKENPYQTTEGCLSLQGQRETVRYQNIEVEYFDGKWKKHRKKFSGFPAQIVQHEMDHLEGILI